MRKTPEYLQRGYPLPDPLEPERQVEICICVPCSIGHANAFLAQLYALTFGKAWEKDAGHSGLLAAAVWLPIVDDVHRQLQEKGVYSMGCNDTAPADRYRFDEDGNLEVSHDNGLTWEDDSANDPRVNPIVIFPPVPGEDGDDKKCTVSNSITTGFEQLFTDELNALETSTTLLLTLYGIIAAFIVFVLGVPLIGIPAFIAALLSLVVNFIAGQIPEEFEAAFTEDVWQQFLCAVYCNVDADGTITEGGFSAILDAVEANVEEPIAVEFFKRHMQLIGSGGMTNLGRAGYGGARDCGDCPCGEEGCGFVTNNAEGNWDRWELLDELLDHPFTEELAFNTDSSTKMFANGYIASPNQVLSAVTEFEEVCHIEQVFLYNAGTGQPNRMVVGYRSGGVWTTVLNEVTSSHSGGTPWTADIEHDCDAIGYQYFGEYAEITSVTITG